MFKNLFVKLKESFLSVFPIVLIVLLLGFTIVDIDSQTLIGFVISTILIIIGMSFFTLGVDISMMPMGESIGENISRGKKPWLMMIIVFVLGFVISISEPDLQVLAAQLHTIPSVLLLVTISIGVGIMLIVYYIKIHFNIKLSTILIISYAVIFIIAFFINDNFVPMAFDSGGVMTGPIVVPFLMALGIGMSTVKSSSNKEGDSFGVIALCTVGPILTVMLMAIIFNIKDFSTGMADPVTGNILMQFLTQTPKYFLDVGLAYAPIIIVFLLYQIFAFKYPKNKVIKITIGLVYTYIGLCLFLMAVNVGFLPVGMLLGAQLSMLNYNWILIPLGFVIGLAIILAEPTIHILIKQVEELTGGAVSKKIMLICLSLGVATSVALSMLRILFGISIWYFILPGYVISLLLTFFVPSMFTSIAFDSGSISSGPMTVTFLLPFAIGACSAAGGNIMQDAFGIVAMVSMAPLLTIQAFGLIYKMKFNIKQKAVVAEGAQCELVELISSTENQREEIQLQQEDEPIEFYPDTEKDEIYENTNNDLQEDKQTE